MTLRLFDIKELKPFDEMALGAVLSRARALYDRGERELYFCTLDKKDLGPTVRRPNLQAAYAACGVAVSFGVLPVASPNSRSLTTPAWVAESRCRGAS